MRSTPRRALAFLLALVLWFHAQDARAVNLERTQQPLRTAVLDTTAINVACQANAHTVATASLDCAAFQLAMAGFTEATLLIEYTKSTATAVNLYVDGALDPDGNGSPNTPWGVNQAADGSSVPTIKMAREVIRWDSPSTGAWMVTFTGLNAPWIRWRFESTGGAVGDTVKVWLVRRGP